MTKRELQEIRMIDQSIRTKLLLEEAIRDEIERLSVEFKEKVQTSGKQDKTHLIADLVDLRALIESDKMVLYEKRKKAYMLFTQLKGRERCVMELRYIASKEWKDIAKELNLSIRRVLEIHGKALNKLFKK